MKNLFFFLLLCTAFSLVSCGGDEDDAPADFMTATVDGSAFEASSIVGFAENDDVGEQFVFTNGTEASTSIAIGLNFATSTGTGSFNVDRNSLAILFSDGANPGNAYFTEGTLSITRNDTTENIVEGTFGFTAIDDADSSSVFNITDGAFKVTYTE